jgi:RNA polymerase sigma-70 factor (ECF subfamily)
MSDQNTMQPPQSIKEVPAALTRAGAKASRVAHNEFLRSVAPYRTDLFRFCRSLTDNVWDAEDLVQETLLRVYGRMGDTHAGLANPKSYLFKTASNQWIDWCRQRRAFSGSSEDVAAIAARPFLAYSDSSARDAMKAVFGILPPRERLALVLKEVFEMPLEEIAAITQTTVGAVKSALHRARERAATGAVEFATKDGVSINHVDRRIVDQAVDFFNRRDLEGLSNLFLAHATSNAPGCFLENGLEEIKQGSLFYTFNTHDGKPQPASYRASCVEVHGELLFVLWNDDRLDDVWRFYIEDEFIAGFDCFYCCPDVLNEIGVAIGATVNTHGYFFEDTPTGSSVLPVLV